MMAYQKNFFLAFFNIINEDLINSYNASFDNGQLTSSQRKAVITLIQKPDKDSRKLNGWRPISLMNVDTKILSKIMVKRMVRSLPKLVHPDQSAFVKGRFIGESVRLISDILEYTKELDKPGILFGADFESAFDSVGHTFLYSVLTKFGFSETFKQWIKLLYNKAESCVINNGYTTKYFPLEAGTRQGDPLSPYLFILVIEVLTSMVRQNDNIQGLQIEDRQIKQCIFADDCTFFLSNIRSFDFLLKDIQAFSKFSLLNVNSLKSEIAWIGSERHNQSKVGPFQWVNLNENAIKILGINFTYNPELAVKLNFENKVTQFGTLLNLWKSRNLTIYGRCQVLKSLAMPKLFYICNVMVPPKHVILNVKRKILEFIWNTKRPKVKYQILTKDYDNGGIKLPDIELRLQTQRVLWAKRLLTGNDNIFKLIPRLYLKSIGGLKHITYNFDIGILPKKLPIFYKLIFEAWAQFSNHKPLCLEEVKMQPLWCNRYIATNKKSFFNKYLANNGINFISDVWNEHSGKVHKLREIIPEHSELYHRQYINWLQIVNCIPKEWFSLSNSGNVLKERITSLVLTNNGPIKFDKITSKLAYTILSDQTNQDVKSSSEYKLMKKYPGLDWKSVCKAIYATCIDTYSRQLQFKIVHNFLTVNNLLYKWKLKETNLCSYCNVEPETLIHIFCHCHVTKTFYCRINDYLRQCNVVLPELTEQFVLYGVTDITDGHNRKLVQHINILYKEIVFKCRDNNSDLTLIHFKARMSNLEKIERRIAKSRNKLHVHLDKWHSWQNIE